MNINALRLFLHIMQRGSLVAAATELNMSPSAASRLLTGLERETDSRFFRETENGCVPLPKAGNTSMSAIASWSQSMSCRRQPGGWRPAPRRGFGCFQIQDLQHL